MNTTRDTVGVDNRAQKNEAPATVQPVTRAKPNKINGILHHVKRALFACFYVAPELFLVALLALAVLGGHHGI